MFLAFAKEKTAVNACLFAQILCDHLSSCGVDMKKVKFQTDNGSEFRRTPGLTDDLVDSFASLQTQQPEGYPYVFIVPGRYDRIQARRDCGNWTVQDGKNPINNLELAFKSILAKAGVENATFHDLRRTCITNWFANGLA